MKLSQIVTDYRSRMQISQREFARRCNLSNSYISFIENEFNPRTGRPIVPTLEIYQKIAAGMEMSVHQLFGILDEDAPVDLGLNPLPVKDKEAEPIPAIHTEEARILAKGIDKLPKEQREQALSVIRAMFVKYADYFEKEKHDHDA